MSQKYREKIKNIERSQVKKGVKAGPSNMGRKLADYWKGQIEAVNEAQAR